MNIVGIVAVGEDLAIGRNHAVPWYFTEDMKLFKQYTNGNACVMGTGTWNSLKLKPLPNRLNIVLSRRRGHVTTQEPGVVWMHNRQEVLSVAKYLSVGLYVIGGRQIYDEFAGEVNQWIVTRIPVKTPDADTFMSPHFLNGFSKDNDVSLGNGLVVEFFRRNA